jgi:hypothetical protein
MIEISYNIFYIYSAIITLVGHIPVLDVLALRPKLVT